MDDTETIMYRAMNMGSMDVLTYAHWHQQYIKAEDEEDIEMLEYLERNYFSIIEKASWSYALKRPLLYLDIETTQKKIKTNN